jgi:hypothetical protein
MTKKQELIEMKQFLLNQLEETHRADERERIWNSIRNINEELRYL